MKIATACSPALRWAALALLSALSWAHSQNILVTYQGRVTDNGAPFTGIGQFKFALITGYNSNQQAIATAALTGQFVTSCTVSFAGSGYTAAPAVTFSGGGGSNAAATASITGGAVTGINVFNAGSGYSNAPTVIIAPPPPNFGYATRWSNDGTSTGGSQPAAAVPVGATNGLFTVVLGDSSLPNMQPIPSSIFAQTNLQLQLWFNDGVNGFAALAPSQPLTTAPYAAYSVLADTASNLSGTVPATQLTGPVGNAQLANNSVTISAGPGLSGGGTVALGASISLANAGVLAVTGSSDFSITTSTGTVSLASSATSNNVPNTLVKRDVNGNFLAGSITLNGTLTIPHTTPTSGILYSGSTPLLQAYGTQNFFAGPGAGNLSLTGGSDTGLGFNTLQNNASGQNNTACGASVLFNNSSGNNNTAGGAGAMTGNSVGSDNTALGLQSLYSNTTGSNNTAVGSQTLYFNTLGNANITLGQHAGYNLTTGSSNIDIGNPGLAGESNTLRIGISGAQSSTFVAGIFGSTASGGTAVFVSSSGQLGTLTSSRRFKEEIHDMGDASDVLLALRPVQFRYKPELDASRTPQFGLVAEEVDRVDPDLVVRDADHGVYSVRYEAVNAMLLNEFLKQHRLLENMDAEIARLKAQAGEVDSLKNQLSRIQARLQMLLDRK